MTAAGRLANGTVAAASPVLVHVNLARGYRGGERQTELLIRGLADLGWAQRLVARRGEPLLTRCDGIAGLDIRAASAGVVGAFAALGNAALVHSHEGRGLQAAWLGRVLRGIPYVVTRRVLRSPRQGRLHRQLYQRAAAVVGISEAIRLTLAEFSPGLKASVIPSATSGLKSRIGAVERLRASFGGELVIGHVGALDDSTKGQRQVIALARRAAGVAPGLRFVLVGSGPDEALLRTEAAGLPNLVFAGQVDNVGDYLAAFDVFLYPSRHEGLGSSVLDAMEFGLPVVATAVGGIPELVTDAENGFLVGVDDIDALETAVARLCSDASLRAQIAGANRRRAAQFSPAAMIRRYVDIYSQVLAKSATRS